MLFCYITQHDLRSLSPNNNFTTVKHYLSMVGEMTRVQFALCNSIVTADSWLFSPVSKSVIIKTTRHCSAQQGGGVVFNLTNDNVIN